VFGESSAKISIPLLHFYNQDRESGGNGFASSAIPGGYG